MSMPFTAPSTPLLSVVLPAYNGMPHLQHALESVSGQTFGDFEIVVVDDGSTDETEQFCDSYRLNDPRLRIEKPGKLGLVGALNHGLGAARGTLIARMDADDIALPTRFEKQIEALHSRKDLVAVGGQMAFMDELGRLTGRTTLAPIGEHDVAAALRSGNCVLSHPTIMMQREAVIGVGGYRQAYLAAEDIDLWLRLLAKGALIVTDDLVLHYRQHNAQVSQNQKLRQWFSTQLAVATDGMRRAGYADPTGAFNEPVDWHSTRHRGQLGEYLLPLVMAYACIDSALVESPQGDKGELAEGALDVSVALEALRYAAQNGLAVSRFRQEACFRLAAKAAAMGEPKLQWRALVAALAENPRRALRWMTKGTVL